MKFRINTKLVLILAIIGVFTLSILLGNAKTETKTKAGQLIISEPIQNGSFLISANTSANPNETISPVLRADFPFNALYIKWNQANSVQMPNFELYVRFLNENWSDWRKMEIDDDYNGKDTGQNEISSQMITAKLTDSFQYKLVFTNSEDKNNLNNLQFTYLDTTKGPQNIYKISSQQDQSLKIISRQEWGADESLRFDAEANNLWPEEYYSPQKFVIHHTAGESANADPKASIRAIYYYHAVTQGWGDIGYNYLIDSQGNIYEGREGGDGIVGGHAYMRNRNTIGIAILGCYDTGKNTCNRPDQLTEAAQISLEKLIAVKAREFNIDPLGQSEFHGQILPNIIGHRDVGSTTCPGNIIYNALAQTKQLAYNFLLAEGGYKSPLPVAAQFVSQSATNVNIEETKTADVYVEYKNTGDEVWRGYEDNYLYIADAGIKNKTSAIANYKMALSADNDIAGNSPTSQAVFKLIDGNVYPGQIGRFKMVLNAPSQNMETKNFTLAWQNKGYLPNTDFSITLNKIACNCGQNTSGETYKASLLESNWPNQIANGTLADVTMKFKNEGAQNWNKDNLSLKIYYDNNLISPFRNDSWYNEWADILAQEQTIAPSSAATFNFRLKAPKVPVKFPHTIQVQYNGQTIYEVQKTIQVTADYAAQITANTLPSQAKANSRPTVKLTFKNIGTKTWTNLSLKSYDLDYTNSWFKDWTWLNSKTVKTIKKQVKPGEEIEFSFRLLSYWKPKTYPQIFKLYNAKNLISLDSKDEFLIYTQVVK